MSPIRGNGSDSKREALGEGRGSSVRWGVKRQRGCGTHPPPCARAGAAGSFLRLLGLEILGV